MILPTSMTPLSYKKRPVKKNAFVHTYFLKLNLCIFSYTSTYMYCNSVYVLPIINNKAMPTVTATRSNKEFGTYPLPSLPRDIQRGRY